VGQGAAYVFTNSGGIWRQQQELTPSDGTADDYFGLNLVRSSDGKTALIGALFKEFGSKSYTGAAYVFTNSGESWSQQQELTASNEAYQDYFGSAVALSSDGKTALIGASGKTVNSTLYQGAAYVFTNPDGSWTQQQELTASKGAKQFGTSVALSSDGNTALVGAFAKNSYQGAAYVFQKRNMCSGAGMEAKAKSGNSPRGELAAGNDDFASKLPLL
jgi:hypothetical protein